MSSSSSLVAVGASYHAYHYPKPWIVEMRPIRKTRTSSTKFIARQIIEVWKRVTGATRRPQRASFLPKDFVLVTSRRRSVMYDSR